MDWADDGCLLGFGENGKCQVWPVGHRCQSPTGAGQWLSLGALAPSNGMCCALQVVMLNVQVLSLLSTPADDETGAPGILSLQLMFFL